MGNHYAANNNFLTKKCAFITNIFLLIVAFIKYMRYICINMTAESNFTNQ